MVDIKKFTGKSERDELDRLKHERKAYEAEIKHQEMLDKRLKQVEREKQKIFILKRELKRKARKVSTPVRGIRKIKGFQMKAERIVHPDRFKDRGLGARKKGRAGRD